MISYFDASALVKRYIEEPGSDAVRERLHDGDRATSRLSEVEISSALARRWREGSLSRENLDRSLATLREDFEILRVVELLPPVVSLAQELLLRHPLRAGDAIQLASCLLLKDRDPKLDFLAFDERLNEAAGDEELTVIFV